MKRYGYVLMAAATWTIFVWVTRLGILWGDHTAAFKAAHAVLIFGSLAAGAAVAWVGIRLLRG